MSRVRRLMFVAFILCGCCVIYPIIFEVRDSPPWKYALNNTRQVTIALDGHAEYYRSLPTNVADLNPYSDPGTQRPLLSWRVALLPFIEEKQLFESFKKDEPWDGPHNNAFLKETPGPFLQPWGGHDPPGLTHCQAFVGPGTAFEHEGVTFLELRNGLANTILVADATEPVPWSKPADLTYNPAKPLPPLGGLYTKPSTFLGYVIGREDGFNAGFGDGSVRFISKKTDEKVLRALIARGH